MWGTRDGTEYIHVLFSLFGRFFGFFFDFTVAHGSKIEKNKINVQIKKIEHGIANICTQETGSFGLGMVKHQHFYRNSLNIIFKLLK